MHAPRRFFSLFAEKLRLSNPWNYKVPLLISIPYLILCIKAIPASTAYMFIGLSYCTILGIAAFGYLTNDLADRVPDKLAGKPNGTESLNDFQLFLIGCGALGFALVPWMVFPTSELSWMLVSAELALFVLYAFPPFRFKEKPVLGVISDALYAHAVPAALAAWTFLMIVNEQVEDWRVLLIALVSWQFTVGLRGIAFHHLKDFENDLSSGTRTLATFLGKEKFTTAVKLGFIPLEFIAFSAFIFALGWNWWLMVAVGTIFFLRIVFWQFRLRSELEYRKLVHVHLDDFYIRWFPMLVLGFLILGQPELVGIAVVHLIMFPSVVKDFFNLLKGRIVPEKKEYLKPEIAIDPYPKAEGVTRIAIATNNLNQYSETFIHSHLKELKDEVIILHNGYLPAEFKNRENGENGTLCKEEWQDLSDPEKRPLKQKCVADFLVTRHVDVVLAEYGPGGAEMMRPCHMANVPMVVHFHGFDASREDVLGHYGLSYPRMFREASAVVVVSEPMRERIIELGCPEPKVKLMPYGIDTDRFQPKGRRDPVSIVSCGRFVKKKAPDKVIRMFKSVHDRLPTAKLTMIGDGELLKTCKELVNQLDISASVQFTGVLEPALVLEKLQQASVFVQHSIEADDGDSEGLPLSILEALSCEVPVVSTRHAGIPSVVINSVTGFLVDEGAVENMALHVIALLQDHEIRTVMGRSGRKLVEQNHSQDDYIARLQKLLEESARQ